jgi:uncharacterized protein (TIGR02246 family)
MTVTDQLPAVEDFVRRLQEAQQNEDVDAFLALFRPDATWVTGHGRRLVGLDEIAAFTRQVLPGAMATSTATYTVEHVVWIRPDVAAVAVRQRPVTLAGNPLPDSPEGRPTYILALSDSGEWQITAAQNTQVHPG